jgi:general nucleoside transport system permease protein
MTSPQVRPSTQLETGEGPDLDFPGFEPAPAGDGPGDRLTFGARVKAFLGSLLIPALAVFTGLLVGALIVIFSDAEVLGMMQTGPVAALQLGAQRALDAYAALFAGSLGDPGRIAAAITSGDQALMIKALRPISESLLSATPLIFVGLAVALGFRSGLFNIGAEGQLFLGAIFAVFAAVNFQGLPMIVHLPLSILFGFLGGALWGMIPGVLKARTGAHEVIVTIMLNYVAYLLLAMLLKNPILQREGSTNPISKIVPDTAAMPQIIEGLRVTWWFPLALLTAAAVSWLLFKSTKGFEFRAVGLNPGAAKYAGISVALTTVLTMTISGGLAGLGGASVMLVPAGTLVPGFSPGYGFDAIAIALLGRSRPSGVVAAALLFGVLRAGSTTMQASTQIPIDLVVVVQSFVIMFIAAPALVRGIYRIKTSKVTGTEVLMKGWGA